MVGGTGTRQTLPLAEGRGMCEASSCWHGRWSPGAYRKSAMVGAGTAMPMCAVCGRPSGRPMAAEEHGAAGRKDSARDARSLRPGAGRS